MELIPKRLPARGQAMLETLVVAAILILVMVSFAALIIAFSDFGYRCLRLISMEYP